MTRPARTGPTPPRAAGPRARPGARGALLVVLALGFTLLMAGVTVHLALRWRATQARVAQLQAERGSLAAKNVVLARAEELLRLSEFQVCNRGGEQLALPWVVAAHHDGRSMALFDSARCQGWKPQELAGGQARALLLSSPEEGCNWGGRVLFYAFDVVRESGESTAVYHVAGAWGRGFDPKCYTVR
jgi:hypothetical protein